MRHSLSSVAALLGTLIVVAGCSSGSGGGAATSGPQASGQPVSSTAATEPSTPGGGGGGLPSDPCQIVTAEDVKGIYGGDVSALGRDENDACAFEIEGDANAGTSAAAGEFAVSFGDEWSTYDDAKVVFGDAVKKIDGLGTDAWYGMGFIHAKVGAGELVVGGVWVGDYDRDLLDQETFEMAKLLLGRV
jgi:hypothetical protein